MNDKEAVDSGAWTGLAPDLAKPISSEELKRASIVFGFLGGGIWLLGYFCIPIDWLSEVFQSVGGIVLQIAILAPFIDWVATARSKARLAPISLEADKDVHKLISSAKTELAYLAEQFENRQAPNKYRLVSNITLGLPLLRHVDQFLIRYTQLIAIDNDLYRIAFKVKSLAELVDNFSELQERMPPEALNDEQRKDTSGNARKTFNDRLDESSTSNSNFAEIACSSKFPRISEA